jgi:peptide chain release factor subunit 3
MFLPFFSRMMQGAAQADVGVLVISARKGEFETGFDRGGQTREHAMVKKKFIFMFLHIF